MRTVLLTLLSSLLAAAPASAQGMFTLDVVFVSRFVVDDPSLEAEATRLRADLERDLGERYLVSPLAMVPPFPDYTAETYLKTCPRNQYAECAYVVGARAKANWVIAARYAQGGDQRLLDVRFVDVAASRTVLDLQLHVDPTDSAEVAQRLSGILDRILAGEGALVDERTIGDDPRAEWERKRMAAEAAAAELAADPELDVMVRGTSFETLEEPKLTLEDLQADAQGEGTKPWETYGLTQQEYVRFKNSGLTIFEWRERATGRARRVLLRGSVGLWSGPHKEYFDGRSAYFAEDLQTAEAEVYHELQRGSTVAAQGEVAFGITPTLDVGLTANVRTGTFTYQFHTERVGDPDPLARPEAKSSPSYEVGALFTYAPLPAAPARPFVFGGASYWLGTPLSLVVVPPEAIAALAPEFPALTAVYATVGGGVEARLGPKLDVWLRASGSMRMGGEGRVHYQSGEPLLFTRYVPAGPVPAFAGGATAGFQVRLAPFGTPDSRGKAPEEEEFEPDF